MHFYKIPYANQDIDILDRRIRISYYFGFTFEVVARGRDRTGPINHAILVMNIRFSVPFGLVVSLGSGGDKNFHRIYYTSDTRYSVSSRSLNLFLACNYIDVVCW